MGSRENGKRLIVVFAVDQRMHQVYFPLRNETRNQRDRDSIGPTGSMTMQRKCDLVLVAASVLCLLLVLDCPTCAQKVTSAASACKDEASPGVIQLTPDPTNSNRLALARKHFYLSSSPFNLANN